MKDSPLENNRSCKDRVMNRIECEQICPRSRRFFQTRECVVWFLWLLSVIVGALAAAVTLFVVTHRQYALFEATHSTFWSFIIDVLPFVWIIAFGAMVVVAIYNFRHTKRGYRYPMWQIFASSLGASVALGFVLHVLGYGYLVDHHLGERMQRYYSQEKMETELWQNPQEGRLLGVRTGELILPAVVQEFTDTAGVVWELAVTDLDPGELTLLDSAQEVKVIGTVLDSSNRFHACGVFPNKFDGMTADDRAQNRLQFHKKRDQEMARSRLATSSPCRTVIEQRKMWAR